MVADYSIDCKCCGNEVSSFNITYNPMFPFWMFHKQAFYDNPKKYLKIVIMTLEYYGWRDNDGRDVPEIWFDYSKKRVEGRSNDGETNKYRVIGALLKLYNNIKDFGDTTKYEWRCWY